MEKVENGDKEKKSKWHAAKAFIFTLVSGVLCYLGAEKAGKLLLDTVWPPGVIYTMTEDEEYYSTTFPIKAGTLVVHPQLQIFYQGKAVIILCLEDLYADCKREYRNGAEDNRFEPLAGEWTKAELLGGELRQRLVEQMGDAYEDRIRICYTALLKLDYQHMLRNDRETEYYRMADGIVSRISTEEVQKWLAERDISVEDDRDALDEIVSVCVDHMTRVDIGELSMKLRKEEDKDVALGNYCGSGADSICQVACPPGKDQRGVDGRKNPRRAPAERSAEAPIPPNLFCGGQFICSPYSIPGHFGGLCG